MSYELGDCLVRKESEKVNVEFDIEVEVAMAAMHSSIDSRMVGRIRHPTPNATDRSLLLQMLTLRICQICAYFI